MEKWLDIKDFEGIYQVSNMGRVRSLDRKVYNYIKKGIVLKPSDNGRGYKTVGLSNGKTKMKHVYIHRLVAFAFIDKVEGKEFINHKDFDKTNNSVSNLEWVTRKENTMHFIKSDRYNRMSEKRETNNERKFDLRVFKYMDKVNSIYDEGYNVEETAKKTGVGRDFVVRLLRMSGKLP